VLRDRIVVLGTVRGEQQIGGEVDDHKICEEAEHITMQ